MRTVLFLSVSASYAHSNLAAWLLRAGAERAGWRWREVEATPHDVLAVVLDRAAGPAPDVLAATFTLFNRAFLLAFIARFKRLNPACRVIGGGPEFLGDNRAFLQRHPEVEAVVRGEGERAFARWLECFDRPAEQAAIPGLCTRRRGRYRDNGMAEAVPLLDDIPSPYPAHLPGFRKPFVLLETSRGCANRCAFCVSGTGGPVREASLERVWRDAALIRAHGVPEVRLVDRTFNTRPSRAAALVRGFRDEFAPLRVHLEIDPARITPGLLAELAGAGPGRFHLEVGIQSLDPAVLRAVGRQGSAHRALNGLARLLALRNVDTHVDLIAGLPGGTLDGLLNDLAVLARMGPGDIQLELLKLLPGTRLAAEAGRLGLVAAPDPPYEILRTPAMTPGDLETARALSRLVDGFYNAPPLRAVTRAASRDLPEFWALLVCRGRSLTLAPEAPGLESRFRLLDGLAAAEQRPALRHAIHYAWLRHGLSAQHGLCRAVPWKGPLPPDAVLVEGDPRARRARAFRADLEAPYVFVYGAARAAAAVYRLPS